MFMIAHVAQHGFAEDVSREVAFARVSCILRTPGPEPSWSGMVGGVVEMLGGVVEMLGGVVEMLGGGTAKLYAGSNKVV